MQLSLNSEVGMHATLSDAYKKLHIKYANLVWDVHICRWTISLIWLHQK